MTKIIDTAFIGSYVQFVIEESKTSISMIEF